MDIAFQGDGGVGMPEDFGERFNFKPDLNGSCCECVPQRVGMNTIKPTRFGELFDVVLKQAGLHYLCCSCQNIGIRIMNIKPAAQLGGVFCQRKGTDGLSALRFSD